MPCCSTISWTMKRFCLPSRCTISCTLPVICLLPAAAQSRYMHFARLYNRSPTSPLRHLPSMQRSFIALTAIITRGVPMHIPLVVCTKHFPRLMHRDNVRIVRALCSAELVQRVARGVALFEIPRPAMRTCSAAGCMGAGFLEERDKERFYGWQASGYDADVHFDNLPDVCCRSQLAGSWLLRKICDEAKRDIQYHEPWPVKSCTSKKWYCIGVL